MTGSLASAVADIGAIAIARIESALAMIEHQLAVATAVAEFAARGFRCDA
jgi:hypothetical protein